MPPPLSTDLTAYLNSKSLTPTTAWLSTFLSTQRPNIPPAALRQTALFRLLASNITETLQPGPGSVFPRDIHDAAVPERRLQGPVVVQVVDVADIGRSRWAQVEALEALERGEGVRGREIVRVVPGETDGEGGEERWKGPHKLTLQDARGMCVYGVEVEGIEGVGMGMAMGVKMVLKDIVVARGVILLDPRGAAMLGGRMEGLHKVWKEDLKERLKGETQRGGD
ncbi:hypothetical protein EJ06DRAFT_477970 [Trichodelitschia bisporula]|uniref:RecQ-mediated genome instability protein 1 n=1 Tax=Trichodelitschia bisporula TaxID=703511 RepID=A0A6G1HVE5_9PEZI|nr:hypothetical protein EJ06DRAFT_477970 [Trichodelitschia bisporula]